MVSLTLGILGTFPDLVEQPDSYLSENQSGENIIRMQRKYPGLNQGQGGFSQSDPTLHGNVLAITGCTTKSRQILGG